VTLIDQKGRIPIGHSGHQLGTRIIRATASSQISKPNSVTFSLCTASPTACASSSVV